MIRSIPAADETKDAAKRGPKLRCDCGRLAVVMLTVRVGLDAVYVVEMPLCEECLELERELWGR